MRYDSMMARNWLCRAFASAGISAVAVVAACGGDATDGTERDASTATDAVIDAELECRDDLCATPPDSADISGRDGDTATIDCIEDIAGDDARPEDVADAALADAPEPDATVDEVCRAHPDGTVCENDNGVTHVVECVSGHVSERARCDGECVTPPAGDAMCETWVDTLCRSRVDGTWCGEEVGYRPDPIGLVTCRAQRVAYIRACGGGCRAHAGESTCYSDDVDVCVGREDGWYCGSIAGQASADVVLECTGGVVTGGVLCEGVCVEQEDGDDGCAVAGE